MQVTAQVTQVTLHVVDGGAVPVTEGAPAGALTVTLGLGGLGGICGGGGGGGWSHTGAISCPGSAPQDTQGLLCWDVPLVPKPHRGHTEPPGWCSGGGNPPAPRMRKGRGIPPVPNVMLRRWNPAGTQDGEDPLNARYNCQERGNPPRCVPPPHRVHPACSSGGGGGWTPPRWPWRGLCVRRSLGPSPGGAGHARGATPQNRPPFPPGGAGADPPPLGPGVHLITGCAVYLGEGGWGVREPGTQGRGCAGIRAGGAAVYRGAQGCGLRLDSGRGISGCRGSEVHAVWGCTGSGMHGNRGARGCVTQEAGGAVYRGAWELGCVVYWGVRGWGVEESGVHRERGAGFTRVHSAP